MKLYFFPGACSLADRIALEWIGAPYEAVAMTQSSVIADTARDRVRAYLDVLEIRLEGRRWLLDERSIADPYLFVMLRWAIRLHIDLQGRGNLLRFLDRMYVDPGVRAALVAEEGSAEPIQASASA